MCAHRELRPPRRLQWPVVQRSRHPVPEPGLRRQRQGAPLDDTTLRAAALQSILLHSCMKLSQPVGHCKSAQETLRNSEVAGFTMLFGFVLYTLQPLLYFSHSSHVCHSHVRHCPTCRSTTSAQTAPGVKAVTGLCSHPRAARTLALMLPVPCALTPPSSTVSGVGETWETAPLQYT